MPPRFRVCISAEETEADDRTIVIGPGHAFGDGRHASTRMCLQALAVFAPRAPFRLLDVGSGSGILSIAAAKLGGEAIGVEIDPVACDVARENARRSGVADRVTFATTWPGGRFDVVVANILRNVLLQLAPSICARHAGTAVIVLSGLVSTDVPDLIAEWAPRLGQRRPEIFEREEWRTLVWRIRSGGAPTIP